MKVLVGCEESQVVCIAFRERGHEAYSCDIIECSGGHPEWHIQDDIINVLNNSEWWDLIILHPDCTAMALSGNRWYGKGMPRHQERLGAIVWTVILWELAKRKAGKAVLENPMSVIWQYLDAPVQYIQPHQFGHGETKKTGLALHNVPELIPTNEVDGREHRIWKMSPGPNRKRDRSKTFPGISNAMAEQWGNLKSPQEGKGELVENPYLCENCPYIGGQQVPPDKRGDPGYYHCEKLFPKPLPSGCYMLRRKAWQECFEAMNPPTDSGGE